MVLRRKVLVGAAIILVAWLVAGSTLPLPPFWSNVVAGLVGTTSNVIVVLVFLEWYHRSRWKPARDAALSTAALQIGLLIHWLHTAADQQQYIGYGGWLYELGVRPNAGPTRANAATTEALSRRVDAINQALRDADIERRQLLLVALKDSLDPTRLDRIRALAFPLLAGTVDEGTVTALNAIEEATQFGYFALEILAASVPVEPAPGIDEREVVGEMFRLLLQAYRDIVAAVGKS